MIPGTAGPGSKALVDRLNRFLLDVHSQGGRVVVVIDEAQNLGTEALEQIRLLTNLETSKEKLLQIILLGQPELRELLRRQSLRQLAQRITARYHLTPLGLDDTARYVRHRLEIAGADAQCPFKAVLRCVRCTSRSHGVPRLINIIADRALVGAYAAERQSVDARLVNAAADEVQFGEPGIATRRWPAWAMGAAAVALLALVLAWVLPDRQSVPQVVAAEPQSAAAATASEPESEPATTAPPVDEDIRCDTRFEPDARSGVAARTACRGLAFAGRCLGSKRRCSDAGGLLSWAQRARVWLRAGAGQPGPNPPAGFAGSAGVAQPLRVRALRATPVSGRC